MLPERKYVRTADDHADQLRALWEHATRPRDAEDDQLALLAAEFSLEPEPEGPEAPTPLGAAMQIPLTDEHTLDELRAVLSARHASHLQRFRNLFSRRRHRGITIAEIMVVVAIVALMLVLIMWFMGVRS